jgi:hypothetical protein
MTVYITDPVVFPWFISVSEMRGVLPVPKPVMFPVPRAPDQEKLVPAQVAVSATLAWVAEQMVSCIGVLVTLGTGFTMTL